MKWFFIIPPVLVGLTTYIALRRLAYQPMRIWLLPYVAGLTLVVGAQIAWIFLTPGGLGAEAKPWIVPIGIALFIVFAPMVVTTFALMRWPEAAWRPLPPGPSRRPAASRSGRAPRATPAARWGRGTSSTAATSSRSGQRSTPRWRPPEARRNDGHGVRSGPHDPASGHVPGARQRGGRPHGPRDQGGAQVRVRVLPGLRRLLRRRDAVYSQALLRPEPREHPLNVAQSAPGR